MTAPEYGYAHKARVVRAGEAEETYIVEVPALAPGILSGPFMSSVRDLQVGDVVLVLQVGATGGDMVIVGRLPEREPDFTLPIGIDDVTGLQAALDNRATDAELAALASSTDGRLDILEATDVAQNGRLTATEGVNTTQDGQISGLVAADAALDGRLDVVEPLVTANGLAITALQGVDTTHNARLDDLESDSLADFDNDLYDDLIANIPRREATNVLTPVAGNTMYWAKVKAHKDISAGKILIALGGVNPAGPGTIEGALFIGASRDGTYNRVAMTATGLAHTVTGVYLRAWNPATPVVITRGQWMIMAIRIGSGYTTQPKLCTSQNNVAGSTLALLHPSAASVSVNLGTKASVATMPTTIVTNDNTWGQMNISFWVALAP